MSYSVKHRILRFVLSGMLALIMVISSGLDCAIAIGSQMITSEPFRLDKESKKIPKRQPQDNMIGGGRRKKRS